ncbi:MAG: glycosyltransferase [Bacteroidales bacterium]|jgi:teichuronic acid biosynthesis glycosyltransferase TuaG|nr:glycosyltransferase [Bacteroidales bacterium]
MENELVSIIMPSYSSAPFIADAIRSTLRQTYPHWELLITDDASTDDTLVVVQPFVERDPRVRLFQLTENGGVAAARNHAIGHARGRYLAFLDSDDCWHPEKLEKQLLFMRQQDHAFTFTAYQLMNSDGQILDKTIQIPPQIDYKQYLKNTVIGCLTVMLDRKRVGEVRFPAMRTSQDMALWLRILRKGFTAYGLGDTLAYYRLNPHSNSADKLKAACDVWRVYRDSEKLSWHFALYNFMGYAWRAIRKRL